MKMTPMERTRRTHRKLVNFPDTKALFEELDEDIRKCRRTGLEGLILLCGILSNGYREWKFLLGSQFPCFAWRGDDTESKIGLTFEKFNEVLYNRFFLQVAELPSMQGLYEEGKEDLREKGLKAYLGE